MEKSVYVKELELKTLLSNLGDIKIPTGIVDEMVYEKLLELSKDFNKPDRDVEECYQQAEGLIETAQWRFDTKIIEALEKLAGLEKLKFKQYSFNAGEKKIVKQCMRNNKEGDHESAINELLSTRPESNDLFEEFTLPRGSELGQKVVGIDQNTPTIKKAGETDKKRKDYISKIVESVYQKHSKKLDAKAKLYGDSSWMPNVTFEQVKKEASRVRKYEKSCHNFLDGDIFSRFQEKYPERAQEIEQKLDKKITKTINVLYHRIPIPSKIVGSAVESAKESESEIPRTPERKEQKGTPGKS